MAETVIPLPAPTFRVVLPPRAGVPPPVKPSPALTPIVEFVRLEFAILLNVFLLPLIVLFKNS